MLPGASVHGRLDDNQVDSIEVLLLYHNPSYPLPVSDGTTRPALLFHDTRLNNATADKISPCAKVSNFRNVTVFHIPCLGHNVLIKYIGEGVIVPRNGNDVNRIGIIPRLMNQRGAPGMLDYSTNIDVISKTFNLAT